MVMLIIYVSPPSVRGTDFMKEGYVTAYVSYLRFMSVCILSVFLRGIDLTCSLMEITLLFFVHFVLSSYVC